MNVLEMNLEKIGFSKLEAAAYIVLVESGPATGYQIAKMLNISRASIYPVLETLYKRGIVFEMPGGTKLYAAEEPENVIERLKKEYDAASETAKQHLKEIGTKKPKEKYINIEGFENILSKTKEMINGAEREIIMHTDIDVKKYFSNEIEKAAKKGVRVIVFTWGKMDVTGLAVEHYSRNDVGGICAEERMMIVTDFKKTMIAGNSEYVPYIPPGKALHEKIASDIKEQFIGMFTENKLLTHVITEHIHFDIYILRLFQKYGTDFIDKGILLGTLMENGEG